MRFETGTQQSQKQQAQYKVNFTVGLVNYLVFQTTTSCRSGIVQDKQRKSVRFDEDSDYTRRLSCNLCYPCIFPALSSIGLHARFARVLTLV